MAQLHINIPDSIKKQAQNELKMNGQTMTEVVRHYIYRLARLYRLSQKISMIPQEHKKLSSKAKKDLRDDSTATNTEGIKE